LKKIRLVFCLFFYVSFLKSSGQKATASKPREYTRAFQLGIFPGISTNGISSGSYVNDLSINLLGGLSAGNRILELGLVSNSVLNSVTGIQIAGLANIIGANTFLNLTLSEQRALEHADFESNQHGIQVAGFLNYVRSNAKGIQLSGAFNIVGFDFTGVQLAGLGNSSGNYVSGFQIGGLYNLAEKGLGGTQVSTLFNYTDGQLAGIQIALVNKAIRIKGKQSPSAEKTTGLQIGLFNFCKEMDGTQVGILNIGGEMHGRQIGLINIFHADPPKENVKNGTPIGLINVGSFSSVRLSYNELFPISVELATGNCANCSSVMGSNMPYNDQWKKLNQNSLIAGFNRAESTWGFGYGFQRVLLNKFVMTPGNEYEAKMNESKMVSFGMKFIHLNRDMKLDKSFNLVSRAVLEYGVRFRWLYVFGGVALNYFLQEPIGGSGEYSVPTARVSGGKPLGLVSWWWPGYSVGLHFL
jgi:hypothetical protein